MPGWTPIAHEAVMKAATDAEAEMKAVADAEAATELAAVDAEAVVTAAADAEAEMKAAATSLHSALNPFSCLRYSASCKPSSQS